MERYFRLTVICLWQSALYEPHKKTAACGHCFMYFSVTVVFSASYLASSSGNLAIKPSASSTMDLVPTKKGAR